MQLRSKEQNNVLTKQQGNQVATAQWPEKLQI